MNKNRYEKQLENDKALENNCHLTMIVKLNL